MANSSLWIDEIALTRNILERPGSGLFAPLDYAQVAPIGFLLVEKAITSLFGPSEYALRAFPLVCGIASLLLFWGLANRILSGWAIPFGVGLFSLGIPFVYFSSQAKQYSSDVAAALFLTLAALDLRRRGINAPRALAFGLVGAFIAWFSQPVLFVMAGIGTALLVVTCRNEGPSAVRWVVVSSTLWAASGVMVAASSIRKMSTLDREYFHWFWADGFMPMPPRSLTELLWLPRKLTWVFGRFELGMGHTDGGLSYRWSPVFAIVMAFGFWSLWRKNRDAALFLFLPILLCVCASAAAIYPFTARVIAFLIPFLLLATAAGASHLLNRWPARLQFLTPVALAVLGGAPIFAIATTLPPARVQHLRPVLEYLNERRAPGDRTFVYYGAAPAFAYYAPRLGIPTKDIVGGGCSLGSPRAYLRQVDGLRGSRRAWIVATHVQRAGELDLITGYLDQIGRRLDAIVIGGTSRHPIESAYGYLYDLSDPNRLASMSADTYGPMLEPVTGPWRVWGCYGVIGRAPF